MARFWTTLALVALMASPALARVHKDERGKVSVEIPDAWTVTIEGNQLTASPKDESIVLIFEVFDGKTVEKVLEGLERELAKTVKDLKPDGEPEELKVNGLKGVSMDAKGKVDGKPVELGLAVLETPNKKALLVFGMGESAQLKKHEAAVSRILQSIKPIK